MAGSGPDPNAVRAHIAALRKELSTRRATPTGYAQAAFLRARIQHWKEYADAQR